MSSVSMCMFVYRVCKDVYAYMCMYIRVLYVYYMDAYVCNIASIYVFFVLFLLLTSLLILFCFCSLPVDATARHLRGVLLKESDPLHRRKEGLAMVMYG